MRGEIAQFLRRARWAFLSERASAMVEVAVMTPVMLLLITGIFSISITLEQKLQLAEAVASGARYLAVDRGDTDPCASTVSVVEAAAPTLTSSNMTFTFVLNGTTTNGSSCSGTTNMISGKQGQLTVTYPCSLFAYGMSFGSCTLSETASEVIQ